MISNIASTAVSRRQALAGLGMASIAATLAACGGGGNSGKTTITYLSWETEEVARPLIDAFEDANPDIAIDFSYSAPTAGYFQTLQTRIAGNQQPTVHRINPETKEKLIGEGLVADLTDEPFMGAIADANLRAYEDDGKIYGASFGAWAAGVVYNRDLLAQAGADDVPQAWDEFLDLCKQLKGAGVTPYRESVQDIPSMFQAFLGAGYDLAGDERGEKKIFTGESTFAEEWPEPMKQWYRLYDEGIVGAESVSLTGTQLKEDFIAGNLAMFITGPWDLADIAASGLNWGISPMPAAPGGEPFATGAPDPGFAISASAQGEELEAAKKFITFLASQEGLRLANEHIGTLVNTSDFTVEVAPEYQGLYDDYLKTSKIYLPMNYWDHASDALQLEGIALCQQLVQGQITVEQVAAGMDTKLASL
ncbi:MULTISPECIES: ABC transporter substrate-binding protein [Actinomyces]|uniref:Bacterial extracellular solute-binding protein n=1 Tax=Actinomyces glycerinitolerans TaxID=1892869 RepID=A0A1M4RWN1_9ACTO|nr:MULTISPECIES: extracellular solute-binding protein [Actinomyces]RAX22249.1 extracellular solute-binding protein [Actinomyces sp. Z5]SHE24386.1 Hypothetical protein ACGLYG10_0587 [Actinomyces glycerinitolerans]